MSTNHTITGFILAFAELLEKGALIAQPDKEKNLNLNAADHPMHLMLAAVLRKALNSHIMGEVANEYHAMLNKVLVEKQSLQDVIAKLTNQSAEAPIAEAAAEVIEGEVVPTEIAVEPAAEETK